MRQINTVVKLRKQVAMQGRPILLLVLVEKGLVDHQLRRVNSVLSTQFIMKMVLMSMCEKAFCSVHGFGPKWLQVLRRKVQSGHGGPEPDKQGKHGCHPKVGEDLKQLIREHIKSYPTRHSHYSRKDNSEHVIAHISRCSGIHSRALEICFSLLLNATF